MRAVVAIGVLLSLATAVCALPASVEEFRTRQATEALTAQGGCHLWFEAVLVYLSGNTKLGTQLLTAGMKDKDWVNSTPLLVETMQQRPYLLRSYLKGATPENGYQVTPDSFELNVVDVSAQPLKQFPPGKVVRLMLRSGGADAPRAIDLERNGLGLYLVRTPLPLCLGIRAPQAGN